MSPDGQRIALGSLDNTIRLWNLDRPKHNGVVRDVRFSPDQQVVVTASFDKTIKFWSLEGTYLKTLRGA
ncbi:WD40 repeat domain-containing protein [Leptothermofonsia sp. ETS-13]|uniref:WD40 repeat domain-containing protein n=1 Tax=Leptothermofonsia sp. ETS-13 TaxID=3035696 RepID=UPI003B9E88DB